MCLDQPHDGLPSVAPRDRAAAGPQLHRRGKRFREPSDRWLHREPAMPKKKRTSGAKGAKKKAKQKDWTPDDHIGLLAMFLNSPWL